MTRISLWMLTCLTFTLPLAMNRAAVADEPSGKSPTQEELEKKFAETMTGATLVGRFTTREMGVDKPMAEDRYTLGKVYKLPNGLWSFETRIQYGERDVKLPLALEVKWAGDTPVITLDNVLVPGIGTFTSRVLVHNDEYAGTWAGGDHGGQMFGRITRAEKAEGK
jgi:hypothetical protein